MWLVSGMDIINLESASRITIGPASLLIYNNSENERNFIEVRIESDFSILGGNEQVENHIRNKITEIRSRTSQ